MSHGKGLRVAYIVWNDLGTTLRLNAGRKKDGELVSSVEMKKFFGWRELGAGEMSVHF